ncbi:MAG: hypothetical protein AAGJ18_21765 [Bacteroidota bacterium]
MFAAKIKLGFYPVLVLIVLFSCSAPPTTTTADYNAEMSMREMPLALIKAIDAHGGMQRWKDMQTWAFTVDKNGQPERQLTDLKTRKVLNKHSDYTVGFDGKEVWITPNKAAFGQGSPRFYHNLYWYFHAFPFVMTDPGINYEVLPQKEINGKTHDVVKISYDAGVGDAPDDYYIAHFDAKTHQMYMLLYTVTYFQGKPGDKYNALIFDDWIEVNGLVVPNSMKGYKYADGELGEQRYHRFFKDIELSTTPADQAMFEMPAGAEIDTLIQH